jgi:arsenate reductase
MAQPDVTVYEKRTCSTCRQLYALLVEHGVEAERVEYQVEGISEAKLRELLRKMGAGPRDVLRMREPEVIALGLTDPSRTDDELIALMAAHPATIQRPIVEAGDRAVLARPVDRVLELVGG